MQNAECRIADNDFTDGMLSLASPRSWPRLGRTMLEALAYLKAWNVRPRCRRASRLFHHQDTLKNSYGWVQGCRCSAVRSSFTLASVTTGLVGSRRWVSIGWKKSANARTPSETSPQVRRLFIALQGPTEQRVTQKLSAQPVWQFSHHCRSLFGYRKKTIKYLL